jgi:hypothetical protein
MSVVSLGPASNGMNTPALPALVAAAGERAGMRFLEFFAANIRNPHTRRAYARAADEFLAWCASVRRAVDRRRPAGARGHLDRGRDARARRAERQATALPALAAVGGERVGTRFLEFAVIICASEGRGTT